MKINDIVHFKSDTSRKPELFRVFTVQDNEVVLVKQDDTSIGWHKMEDLTLKYEYPTNNITASQLEQLLKELFKMKDFTIEEHVFPSQKEDQDYWSGYRGYWIDNGVFRIQVQYGNTNYVRCLLPSFKEFSYFSQVQDTSYDHLKSLYTLYSKKLNQEIDQVKKEIELLS